MSDGQLLVTFSAKTDKYERALARARRRTETDFRGMRREAETAARGMETSFDRIGQKLGSLGKSVAGGLVAGGVVAALEGIRQAVDASVKSVLKISDAAKIAGVSFKAFQELKFVADQNRIRRGRPSGRSEGNEPARG